MGTTIFRTSKVLKDVDMFVGEVFTDASGCVYWFHQYNYSLHMKNYK